MEHNCVQGLKYLAKNSSAIKGVLEAAKRVVVGEGSGLLRKVADGVDRVAKTAKVIGDATDKATGGGSSTPPDPDDDHGKDHEDSVKSRIKDANLPNEGKIRFVPPKDYKARTPLPRGPNKGYVDKFGNEWTKGPSRTKDQLFRNTQLFEWDVQLSKTGKEKIGWASRDGRHVNISLDGKITH